MVHVISDVYRHAGHADVIRELVDGAVGRTLGGPTCQRRTTRSGQHFETGSKTQLVEPTSPRE